MMTTTTVDLTRESLDKLDHFLVGRRTSDGRRVSKRQIFQTLLNQLLADPERQKQLLAAIEDERR